MKIGVSLLKNTPTNWKRESKMINKADYSLYKCPYEHLEKEEPHKLDGPEGYANVYSVWCTCGFKGPIFYLEPDDLKLELK